MRLIAVLIAGLAAPALTSTPTPPPRQAVAEIADAIEQNYFDPGVAGHVASALRAEAAAGRYDGQSPAQLATTLSTRLVTVDRHFHVAWRPPAATTPAARQAPPAYGPEEQDRRSGYGFRQVSILSGNIGYIALDSFAPIDFAQTGWPSRATADAALQLVRHTDGVIIDLRDNGGGDPSMVGYLASAFVGPDRDIYNVFHGRQMTASERPATPYSGPRLAMPLYILISGRTGSAAESFAYTLQAAHRATIIGEPSAGAANPGGSVDLPGGYSLFVSRLTPINPLTHANWETLGVKPDRGVMPADALDTAHVAALEAVIPTIPAAERIDAERALEAAKAVRTAHAPVSMTGYVGQYGPTRIVQAGDGLQAVREHRPPVTLGWIGGDTFFPLAQPSTRYRFDKAANGRFGRLVVSFVDGGSMEFDRTATP